ncbi:MAG: DUF4412 domain-containing protein [Bacteroidia bacterium]|nr:DUF4412 domain-containing protein [Bacteroidia bacterium]
MKTLTSFLIVFLALCTQLVAQKFEGTVTMTNSLYEGLVTVFHIQGDKAAMFTQASGATSASKTIIDRVTGEYQVVNMTSGQPQVVNYNLADPQFALHPSQNTSAEVNPTGETKVIDGFTCEKVLVNKGGSSAELWVATQLANLDITSFMIPSNLRREGRFLHVEGVNGFPLEIQGTDIRSGKPFVIKNKVSIGKVDGEKLAIPAGATIIEMTSLKKEVEDANGDSEKLKQIKQNLDQN